MAGSIHQTNMVISPVHRVRTEFWDTNLGRAGGEAEITEVWSSTLLSVILEFLAAEKLKKAMEELNHTLSNLGPVDI